MNTYPSLDSLQKIDSEPAATDLDREALHVRFASYLGPDMSTVRRPFSATNYYLGRHFDGPTSSLTARMSFQSLNEDALTAVVSHLDASDAHNLSLTTRAVYILARYQSLTSVTVHSFANTVKFCQYFLADMRHRSFALRTLEIYRPAPGLNMDVPPSGEEQSAAARLLADVLVGATNLQRLALINAEAWITHDHHIADAISSMTRLIEIELEGLGQLTSDMISKLQSQPRKLSLTECERSSTYAPSIFHLEEDLCLQSVQHLVVTEYAVCLITLAACARAFPNVRWADLGSLQSQFRPNLTWYHWPAADSQADVEWPLLEHLKGPTAEISGPAFVVPVHLVEITTQLSPDLDPGWCDTDEDWESDERLAAVMTVRNAQPIDLLASAYSDIEDDFWLSFVTSSGRLRYLSVTLNDIHVASQCVNQIYAWWERFAPVVAHTNVVCLKVQCASNPETYPWDPTIERQSIGSSRVEAFGAMAIMLPTLGKSVPSLRYLCLHGPACSVPEDDEMRAFTFWWRFRGTGGDRFAEPLDVAIGERVAAYMASTRYDYTMETFDGDAGFEI
ncbi:uncharacterized protein B0H18DRAFT_1006142 [Fomitopsis serialis]|uniref:uncharacterized protein n=1 Tax=Fomitopsis serialis TaxID=139415 RepID=UPI0020078213|nr:uncharacterized protein B0H18DRAFT_1006142 [Neoantrodia serialis]KAH9926448.1 hypothetical protein B0H18DRAFT_1006142 [Neoantrodia serialis]